MIGNNGFIYKALYRCRSKSKEMQQRFSKARADIEFSINQLNMVFLSLPLKSA